MGLRLGIPAEKPEHRMKVPRENVL